MRHVLIVTALLVFGVVFISSLANSETEVRGGEILVKRHDNSREWIVKSPNLVPKGYEDLELNDLIYCYDGPDFMLFLEHEDGLRSWVYISESYYKVMRRGQYIDPIDINSTFDEHFCQNVSRDCEICKSED